MGGRGGSSGGSKDFEKTARSLNPNATPEQVQQFTQSMQSLREQRTAQTIAITDRARSAIGLRVERTADDISDAIGFGDMYLSGPNKWTAYKDGHIAVVTTKPTNSRHYVDIESVMVRRVK